FIWAEVRPRRCNADSYTGVATARRSYDLVAPVSSEEIRDHCVREVVLLAGRRVPEEGSGKDMRVAAGNLDLRRESVYRLIIGLLTYIFPCRPARNFHDQGAGCVVKPVMYVVKPPG